MNNIRQSPREFRHDIYRSKYDDKKLLLDQLYKNTHLSLIVTIVNASLLSAVLWGYSDTTLLLKWIVLVIITTLSRYILVSSYKKQSHLRPEKIGIWYKRYFAGAFLAGSVWGIAGFVLYPDNSVAHQVLIAFVAGGMVAGAVPILSPALNVFLAFSLTALTPVMLRFLITYDEIHTVMAVMTFIFMLMMYGSARHMNAHLKTSLRLRHKNNSLINNLESHVKERTKKLIRTQNILKEDIIKRNKIEADLRKEKTMQHELIDKLNNTHEQLLHSEKMASVGQLAAGVAHEINNPVGFVGSNLHILEEHLNDIFNMIDDHPEENNRYRNNGKIDLGYIMKDTKEILEESLDGISRIKQIVNDLKDFSHADEQEWKLSDIHNGLNSTLNIINNEIKYKARVIKKYGDIPLVECIASQLNQVFMNILVNAAHAIEHNGMIIISTGISRDRVFVSISDNGKGISQQDISRIFDPFFTTKPVGQGTGLGLSLSYGIIKSHGGKIEVDSNQKNGTCFKVWLPIRQSTVSEDREDVSAPDDLVNGGDITRRVNII